MTTFYGTPAAVCVYARKIDKYDIGFYGRALAMGYWPVHKRRVRHALINVHGARPSLINKRNAFRRLCVVVVVSNGPRLYRTKFSERYGSLSMPGRWTRAFHPNYR